jgi:hypothetical protein
MDHPITADSSSRFEAYVEGLVSVIGHADRARPLRDYCVGLMMPGERKSVEPMAAVTAPERTAAQINHSCILSAKGAGRTRRSWPRCGKWSCRRSCAMGRSRPGLSITRVSPTGPAFGRGGTAVLWSTRCGPSGTFQTRLRPCADDSFSPSSKTCRDVRAAPLRSGTRRSTKLYGAVRLGDAFLVEVGPQLHCKPLGIVGNGADVAVEIPHSNVVADATGMIRVLGGRLHNQPRQHHHLNLGVRPFQGATGADDVE